MYDNAVTGWKSMDHGSEIREFLTSRRARDTPDQARLPSYGARRVSGLRRAEAAQLAGVSVEYEQVRTDTANRRIRREYAPTSSGSLGPPDVRPSLLGNEPASWADT
ncbi:hypothetical protein ACFWBS_17755 [Streptomyces mirabilis]|uniref:hypothetical protein n=1 Tax=Streptomyces mirabilis TaxID=68239 RepID=UPI0036620D83